MSEIKNIKILENKDCQLSFYNDRLDNISNKVFIDFIVRDNSVVYNEVVESPEDTPIFKYSPDKDGEFTYYRIVVPTLEYYSAGNELYSVPSNKLFYIDSKIYKTEVELNGSKDYIITSSIKLSRIIDEVYELAKSDNNCYWGSKSHFCLCHLRNCLTNNMQAALSEFIENGCESQCYIPMKDVSNLSIISLYALNLLLCSGTESDMDEATRIYNIINSCDGFLCKEDYTNTIYGGCNCGKNS